MRQKCFGILDTITIRLCSKACHSNDVIYIHIHNFNLFYLQILQRFIKLSFSFVIVEA